MLLAFCVRQVVCQTVVVLLVVEEIPALLAMAVVDHVQELLGVALPLVDALRASILLYV